MRAGTIVDATIIAAPSSTKNEDKARDPEMHQTKKGKQWFFESQGPSRKSPQQWRATIRRVLNLVGAKQPWNRSSDLGLILQSV